MARARLQARSVETMLRTTKTPAAKSASTVEMKFKNVKRIGGSEVSFDLDVRAGNSTDIAIVSAFTPDNSMFEHDILVSATCEMRDIRISTERPVFVFTNRGAVVASVQVDLGAARTRTIGTPLGSVYIR